MGRYKLAVQASVAPASASSGVGALLVRGVSATFAAALVAAGLDAAVTFARLRSPIGRFAEGTAIVIHLLAAWLLMALVVGAAAAVVVAAAKRIEGLADLRQRFGGWCLRPWRPSAEGFSVILSATVSLAFGFGVTLWVVLRILGQLHNKPMMASAIVLGATAVLACTLVVGVVLYPPLAWIGRRLGRFGAPAVVLGPLGAALLVAAVAFLFKAPKLLPGVSLVPLFLGLGFVVIALAASRFDPLARASAGRNGRWLGLAAIGLSLGLAVFSALRFGRRQNAAFVVYSYSPAGGTLVRLYAAVVDLDRDGYSPLWGGGDCDDGNAEIHPGGRDVPANRLDEDCFGGDAAPAAPARVAQRAAAPLGLPRMNVVLITLDALRSDRVGAYGYRRHPTTPNIDRFAREAARFSRCFAQSSRSLRSVASMMTGLYPSQIRWQNEFVYPSPRPEMVLVAERLRDGGYDTAAFANTDYFRRASGTYQGFHWVEARAGFKTESSEATSRASTFLETRAAGGRPFFVWLHFMNAHEPYGGHPPFASFGHSASDLYDQEIADADAQVGRVLTALAQSPVAARTAVIVTSDHGEEFGEHGRSFHSTALYRESIQVPLLARVPGAAPRVVESLVGLLDLAPTIVELAHGRAASNLAGRSLVPLVFGFGGVGGSGGLAAGVRDSIFAEIMPDGQYPLDVKSILQGDWHLLYDVRGSVFQLYDLRKDPTERVNLVDRETAVAHALRARLTAWLGGATDEENRTEEVIQSAVVDGDPTPQIRSAVRFGDAIELVGYDASAREVSAGEFARYTFYLRCRRAIGRDLPVVLRFEATDGGPLPRLLNGRHTPVRGRYPTSRWQPGQIVRDTIEVPVNDDAPRGDLRVFLAIGEPPDRLVPDRPATAAGEIEIRGVRVVR